MKRHFRTRKLIPFLLLAVVAAHGVARSQWGGGGRVGSQSNPSIEIAVDTAVQDQDGLLVLYGGLRFGGEVGLPVGAGDINGDGRDDVAFCEMYASAGAGNRVNNGQVNFYISDGRDSGSVDAAQSSANVFTLAGAHSGDLLGTSVATGDVNNDGIKDVVACASANDGPGQSRFNAGAVYIVPGKEGFNLKADLQTIDNLPPDDITVIYGPQQSGRMGIWVDTGDVDGDGVADVVIGADQLNSSAGQHVGGAIIVFGSNSLPRVIDLAAPPAGVRIARILGASPEDHNGAALHVGDINGDGFGDVVLGASIFRDSASYVTPQDQDSGHDARGASFGGLRPGCGEVNVIYGLANWPEVIDLRDPPTNTTRVVGAGPADLLGSQLFSADLNGDGARELILGALQANAPDARGRTGAVYVVYGAPEVVGATIDLATPEASGLQISSIFGENHLDCAGDSVRSYDVNNDGFFDLFIGSPEHTFSLNGDIREDAGDTKIIFGQPGFLPSLIKLFEAPAAGLRVFRLVGPEGGDEFSYRLAGGDVDGDGFTDYIANAMHGDGFSNRAPNAGEVYVFSGKKLSQKVGMLPDTAPPPNLIRARLIAGGQVVTQANAGQPGLRVEAEGVGLKADTQILINDTPVVSRLSSEPSQGFPVHIVELDENISIRNTVGQLTVRARQTNPPSETSNAVVAGGLVGPQINSVNAKRKAAGPVVLGIDGAGFQSGIMASVIDPGGTAVPLKRVIFVDPSFVRIKIRGVDAPPGLAVRVRFITGSGVRSNEVTVTVP
jgi:hypothetical protein